MKRLTRRDLALGAAGLALAGCVPKARTFAPPTSRQFPPDFIWGAAIAAFQSEGALTEDGRGPSVWDVFGPEHILDHSDASAACDSYHRYVDDAALAGQAKLKAYRFSISWTRLLPQGEGAVNEKGLDYYKRFVDALLAQNVTPYATLFHWDLPQALYEKGGWKSRDTAARLGDYAALVGQRLGDRLKHFIVMNEAAVHCFAGHVLGFHAPGLKGGANIGPVTHHQNLGQGLAIQALRAAGRDFTIGSTLALQPSRPGPGGVPLLNDIAAEGFDAAWNGAYLDPLLKGSYPKNGIERVGPYLRDGDLATTHQPIDFLGVNYYSPEFMRFTWGGEHIEQAPAPAGGEHDIFDRLIDPSGLSEMLQRLRVDYGNPRVMITENGCSDPLSSGPAIQTDSFRIDYLRQHIEAVKGAMEAGSKINGYFVWSLLDNWEWSYGYRSKFGMVAHDRDTGVRTTKQSYSWYARLAESGTLDATVARQAH